MVLDFRFLEPSYLDTAILLLFRNKKELGSIYLTIQQPLPGSDTCRAHAESAAVTAPMGYSWEILTKF